jgi:hypothetical protein
MSMGQTRRNAKIWEGLGKCGMRVRSRKRSDCLDQWFSNFVRPRPGKLFFIRRGPCLIDARARRLRNTGLDHEVKKLKQDE